jgi:predicted Ser/Thr protein kinase
MSAEASIDELVGSLADGGSIDWAALEADADEEMLRLLAHLKTVAGVAEVHRTSVDDEDTGPAVAVVASRASGLADLGQWGHLQLVRKVGEGSYGEVFHARDTWLDHPVALKLLRADLSDRVAPTRLLDEARVLVKVRHSNVVAVYGADLQHGRVGFWMEFVQGQRLDDLVAFHGLLGADEAAAIGQELCAALAAVHEAGLLHRDVKAQNVIREPRGRVVLMDFGAGQLMAEASGHGGAGTPLYLAPEMFADAPASVQTDIYALGVLLYFLVTAGYPVPARTLHELKDAHARGRRRPLLVARPGLPRGFVNAVERMLAADPAVRYPSAAEALAALKRFTAPASLARRLLLYAGRLAAGVAVIAGLGLINTATFNLVMGRTGEFATDSAIDWFRWGLSSLVAPAVYISVAFAGWMTASGAARLIVRLSATANRLYEQVRGRGGDFLIDRGFDDPALGVQIAIGTAAATLALIVFGFGDCFAPVTLYVTSSPPAALATLHPDNEARFDLYGLVLDLFLLLYGLVIVKAIRRTRAAGQPIGRATRVMAWVIPALGLMVWEMPYRLVYHNAFTRVDVADTRCYEIGRNTGTRLLHCPDVEPPRNRIVPDGHPSLAPRGVVESIFTPANRSHPAG